jgi:hypothetical protein
MSVRRRRRFALILLALTLLAPLANAFTATLEWDANQEPDIAGYKVYIGSQSGDYSTSIDAGLFTRQLIQSLEPGHPYYFAITAYTSNAMESAFSDEVIYTVPIDGSNTCLVPLRMTFSAAASPVTIHFICEAGRPYIVQASVDLNSWQTIYAVTPLTSGTHQWLDAEAPNYPKRFYRVVGLPQ